MLHFAGVEIAPVECQVFSVGQMHEKSVGGQ